ncbi:MAG TPA: porin family protein [Chitinophagaceae bacterium]|nr:porin family protein [Chitinophagaceae bacterium]
MKKLFFFSILFLSHIFLNQSFAQNAGIMSAPIFAYGKINGEGAHAEAVASLELDPITFKYKGSASDEKDRARVAGNLGILFSEGFIWGGSAPEAYNVHGGGLFFAKDDVGGALNPEYYDGNAPSQKKPIYLYLSEEPEFVIKSTKSSFGGAGNTTITTLNYLQLPVLINYITPVAHNTAAIHAGIGVYMAYALSGKYKNGGQTQDVHLGNSDNDDFKRTDFGIAINAGYKFLKKWNVFINYDWGLKNLSNQSPDPDIYIRGFSLNVGYHIF